MNECEGMNSKKARGQNLGKEEVQEGGEVQEGQRLHSWQKGSLSRLGNQKWGDEDPDIRRLQVR